LSKEKRGTDRKLRAAKREREGARGDVRKRYIKAKIATEGGKEGGSIKGGADLNKILECERDSG
jgi:hypothetical protein